MDAFVPALEEHENATTPFGGCLPRVLVDLGCYFWTDIQDIPPSHKHKSIMKLQFGDFTRFWLVAPHVYYAAYS